MRATASFFNLLLMSLVLASVKGGGEMSCPDSWSKVGENCYKVSPGPMNWHYAQQYCAQQGGNLIEIRHHNKQALLSGFLSTGSYYWIGLTDLANEGNFVWQSDFQGATSTFTYWRSYQPDNYQGNEHCVHLSWDFRWNDMRCEVSSDPDPYISMNFHALCETSNRV